MKQKASSSPSARLSSAAWRLLIGGAALLLAACGSGLDEEDPTVYVRSINLVDDSPTLEFLLGDTAIASIAYSSASTFGSAHAGEKTVNLAVVQPAELVDDDDDTNDEPIPLTSSFTQSFSAGTDYTLIAYGTLAQPQLLTIGGTQDRNDVSDDKGALRIVHANPQIGSVDIYVTAPQAGIVSPQLLGTLAFGQSTDYLDLSLTRDADLIDTDSTLYADLTFTVNDSQTGQEIFRSGAVGLTEQTRALFVVAANKGPGPAPLRLIEFIRGGTSSLHVAPDDEAALRFAHVSHDSPTLDVLNSSFQDPLAQNVAFRGTSSDSTVSSNEVSLIAVPSDNYGAFVFLEEFDAAPDTFYTAYAVGPLAAVDAVVLTDDARSIPTQTSFRFLHAASSLGEDNDVDIYVVPPGTALNLDEDDSVDDSVPTFSSIAYRSGTSYKTLKAGTYEAYFAVAGTTTTVLGPVSIQADNGTVQTFALINSETGDLELMPVSDTR